jgi:hypothetical protein
MGRATGGNEKGETMNASHEKELDLAIPDLHSDEARHVLGLLKGLPGISFVRIGDRGAFVRHRDTLGATEICETLQRAGFRASIFQDSTGRTGLSSQ